MIAQEIVRLREARGWTQYQLAKEAGVQRTQLRKIEAGEWSPRVDTLQKIAAALQAEFIVK